MIISQMSQSEEGWYIVLLIFVFIGIGGLYVEFYVNPKERREQKKSQREWDQQEKRINQEYKDDFEKIKTTNPTYLNSKPLFEQKKYLLSKNIPSCKKCGEDFYTIWDMNKSTLTIRCNGCKKKYVIRNDDIEDNFVSDINNYFEGFMELVNSPNPYLEKYHLHSYDFSSLRKDFPKYRGVIFEGKGEELEPIIDKINSDEPSRRILDNVKNLVWNRDGGKCVECGSREKLEFDHIIPFSKGGSNGYRNIQLLCEECNRKKSNNIG